MTEEDPLSRPVQFLRKLTALLTEYGASIEYFQAPGADDHGFCDGKMVLRVDDNPVAEIRHDSWISHENVRDIARI